MKYTGCLSPGASSTAPGCPQHFNKKTCIFIPAILMHFDAAADSKKREIYRYLFVCIAKNRYTCL